MPGLRRFSFVHVDVFTRRPLEGNPLAVFTDASGLADGEMQSVAREMSYSETAFVLPRPGSPAAAPVRVRIFTVDEELPFAGHPTLGTASVLRGAGGAREVVLELGVGEVAVTFEERSEGAFGEMRQRAPVFGATYPQQEVARALGVGPDALDPALPVQTVSTGLAFAMVAFRSLETLAGLRVDWGRLEAWLAGKDASALYLVCRETVDPDARLHARLPGRGGEDPATGSAAGCCAAWMVAHGVAAPEERVLIEQGLEMSRPSRIFVRAGRSGGAVGNVRVGGYVAEVGRGELTLPAR